MNDGYAVLSGRNAGGIESVGKSRVTGDRLGRANAKPLAGFVKFLTGTKSLPPKGSPGKTSCIGLAKMSVLQKKKLLIYFRIFPLEICVTEIRQSILLRAFEENRDIMFQIIFLLIFRLYTNDCLNSASHTYYKYQFSTWQK